MLTSLWVCVDSGLSIITRMQTYVYVVALPCYNFIKSHFYIMHFIVVGSMNYIIFGEEDCYESDKIDRCGFSTNFAVPQ